MRGVLVDLLDDAEGYVPLDVEYVPDGQGRPMEYRVIQRYSELASPIFRVAKERGVRLANRLRVTYIAHHL